MQLFTQLEMFFLEIISKGRNKMKNKTMQANIGTPMENQLTITVAFKFDLRVLGVHQDRTRSTEEAKF